MLLYGERKDNVQVHPFYAIITNISTEHLETYQNLEDIENNFLEFTKNTSSNGGIIINIDSIRMKEFVKKIKHPKIISYGLDETADIRIANISLHKHQSCFDVYKGDKYIYSIGNINFNDFPTYLETKGEKYANERRRLYKIRHKKEDIPNTKGYYALHILW